MTITQFEKVPNFSFLTKIENGTIVLVREMIDTSTLGKKKIIIVIRNKIGKEQKYRYSIKVIEG